MSGASLNTARALLKAENFDGARRIVRKALDEDPKNINAWQLRVDIEIEAKQPKEALKLVRQILAENPQNAGLRNSEFEALMKAGKKREARKIRDRFKTDFPFLSHRIELMDLQLDAASGKTKSVSKKLQEFSSENDNPIILKDLGIAHHRIDDIFRARRMMDQAHPEFPNDPELNAAMATNYFQLARPGTARKYARLALAADPSNRRMALLIKTSWLMYFPPFFLLSLMLALFYGFDSLVGRIAAWIALIPIVLIGLDFYNIAFSVLIVLTGFELNFIRTLIVIGWIALLLFVTVPAIYNKFFKRKKSVTLKKY